MFFVGEALGASEEEQGIPFCGDAGAKLDYALEHAGIDRKTVRIGNVCRCRPPRNATPPKKNQDACYPFLLHDILTGKPDVIVALGAVATKRLLAPVLGKQISLDAWRGFPRRVTFFYEGKKGGKVKRFEHSAWVIGTHHPSACLRDWTKDQTLIRDLRIAREYAEGRQTVEEPGTVINVARNFPDACSLLERVKRQSRVVVDLETTSLNIHEAKTLCIGFCWKAGEAHVLPMLGQGAKPFWSPTEYREIVDKLTDALLEVRLIGQNVKYDLKCLRKLTGIVDFRVAFDTMNAHHCLDENRFHNLTFLAQHYLNFDKYDHAMHPYNGAYQDAPNEVLWRYNAYDVDATWRLYRKFAPMIKAEKVEKAFKIEIDLIVPLADVEYRGMQVDREKLHTLTTTFKKDQDKAQRRLNRASEKYLGRIVNANSPKQLAELIKATGGRLTKQTPTGAESVDKNVLKSLTLAKGRVGSIALAVQDLRKTTKVISTYLEGPDGASGFLRWIGTKDRIHPSYNTHIARTGRLSADDPPIQTVPRIGGLRSMFTPDVPGKHLLISVDYKAIELRVMAWDSNDKTMTRELLKGDDLHTRMAITKKLNRDPTDKEFKKLAPDVTKQERALAKSVNFGIPYGISSPAIVEQNPDSFPIEMRREQRKQVVQSIINAYFDKYWELGEWREKQVRIAKKFGYLRTTPVIAGRKRRFDGVNWFNSDHGRGTSQRDKDLGHLEREAMNFKIQSLASDSLSLATKRVYDGIRRVKIPCFRMIMTLHDQLLFNVPIEYKDEAIDFIKDWMQVILPQDAKHKSEMPLVVDVSIQTAWGLTITGETEY